MWANPRSLRLQEEWPSPHFQQVYAIPGNTSLDKLALLVSPSLEGFRTLRGVGYPAVQKEWSQLCFQIISFAI